MPKLDDVVGAAFFTLMLAMGLGMFGSTLYYGVVGGEGMEHDDWMVALLVCLLPSHPATVPPAPLTARIGRLRRGA